MTIAADYAARKALATYLQTALSLSADACQPDWFPATMALPRPAAIAIHAAGPVEFTDDSSAPTLLSCVADVGSTPPTATATYRMGEYSIPLAVDLWTSTEGERDRWLDLVERALNHPVAISGEHLCGVGDGLLLTCAAADYHSAPVSFDTDSYSALPEPEGVQREEWRATFQVKARLDRLRVETIVRQATETVYLGTGPRTTLVQSTTGTTPHTIYP